MRALLISGVLTFPALEVLYLASAILAGTSWIGMFPLEKDGRDSLGELIKGRFPELL